MIPELNRRTAIFSLATLVTVPSLVVAQTSGVWSASQAYEALRSDLICMVDVRSRQEWSDTGLAEKAWAISLHEDREVSCAAFGKPGTAISSMSQRECWDLCVGRDGLHLGYRS